MKPLTIQRSGGQPSAVFQAEEFREMLEVCQLWVHLINGFDMAKAKAWQLHFFIFPTFSHFLYYINYFIYLFIFPTS
jgi:hypothetical protein